MKIAAFQFRGSSSIEDNLAAVERGVALAASQGVRFLITQECALCGYPPIETASVRTIDFGLLQRATRRIQDLAIAHEMYVGVGTILRSGDRYTNSIAVLSPNENAFEPYSKRALWGWDRDNFGQGTHDGIYVIDGRRLGIRVCYEVRFPEYFRELFRAQVRVSLVSFCDVAEAPNPARYDMIKAHLVTRATENAMHILSANSISQFQTAPTCLIDPDGYVVSVAPPDQEYLLAFDLVEDESNLGRDGRIFHSRELLDTRSR